jgi:hypothetical protein
MSENGKGALHLIRMYISLPYMSDQLYKEAIHSKGRCGTGAE